jgi:hypothetical protein
VNKKEESSNKSNKKEEEKRLVIPIVGGQLTIFTLPMQQDNNPNSNFKNNTFRITEAKGNSKKEAKHMFSASTEEEKKFWISGIEHCKIADVHMAYVNTDNTEYGVSFHSY